MSKSNAGHTSGPESDQHYEVKFGDSAAPHGAEKDNLWEWTARVRVKKYEVGGSFLVELFLGSVPTDPRQWRTSPNFVGAHYVFTNSVPGRGDAEVEGFVDLNDGIAEHSGLDSLDPNAVVPYLTHNLDWRVQRAGGEPVDLASVPSLEVTVFATPLTWPPGSDFPVPGERRAHRGITAGRPGGSGGADAGSS
ncbi:hypothetical protein B0H14DRAFT_2790221 [Mycena olivaceomarginata]|nr:hypothetical protein B0H14DRAFT_2790221 [Mycena olivaceomarginata]